MKITRKHLICLLVFVLFAGMGAYWTHLGQALLAVEQRRLILAGPMELLQGGVGVIGRHPVFLQGE